MDKKIEKSGILAECVISFDSIVGFIEPAYDFDKYPKRYPNPIISFGNKI
jgi:hypothetical protein